MARATHTLRNLRVHPSAQLLGRPSTHRSGASGPWRPIAACQRKPADSAESDRRHGPLLRMQEAKPNTRMRSSLSDSRRESEKAGGGLSSPRSRHRAHHTCTCGVTGCVWTMTKCERLPAVLEATPGSGLAGWSSFPQRLGNQHEDCPTLIRPPPARHPSSIIHDP